MRVMRLIKKLTPISGLALIACVLLWRALVGGEVLLAADFVGHWSPWKAQLSPAGPPHNADLSDSILYYYPSRLYASQSIRRGEWPLWNPYTLCGTPFLGTGESAVLSPLTLLFYLLPTAKAFGYTAFVQLLLAGVFMLLLLREVGVSPAGAFLGACTFMLNGFFVVWLEMLSLVAVGLWLPLALLLIRRWFRLGRARDLLLLALVIGAQFLAGFLQMSLYFLTACGLFSVWEAFCRTAEDRRARGPLRAVLGVSLATLLGTLLASAQLLPHIELIRLSQREALAAPWKALNLDYLRHLVTFVWPDFYGSPVGNHYHGAVNYTELCGYIGVAPLLLAFLAIRRWRRRETMFFLVLALFALAIYLETPLNAALYYLVPGYHLSIGSTRIIYLFCFAGAALAAIGFDSLFEPGRARSRRQTVLQVLIIGVAVLDLLRFGTRHLTTVRPECVYPETRATTFLQRMPGLWRVRSVGAVLPPNSGMTYGIQDVQGYESLFLRRYKQLVAATDPAASRNPNYKSLRGHGTGLDSRLLDLLNVRYVLSDHALAAEHLHLRYDDEIRVYENETALPRAFVAPRFRVVAQPKAALAALRGPAFRPDQEVVLEQDPGVPAATALIQADVQVTSYAAQRVVIRADLSAAGVLVLADAFYPGWVARVDGVRRDVLVADYVLRAVALPAGRHTVEFIFRPWSFYLGLTLSGAALIVLVVAAALGRRIDSLPRFQGPEDGRRRREAVRDSRHNSAASVRPGG
jgi:hypothetical protein